MVRPGLGGIQQDVDFELGLDKIKRDVRRDSNMWTASKAYEPNRNQYLACSKSQTKKNRSEALHG